MKQNIASLLLLVKDYDEALVFYRDKLHFELIEDVAIGKSKRWLKIAPPNSIGTRLVLKQAESPEQVAAVGNQAGGGVFMIIETDDFWRDYHAMENQGIRFLEEPRKEPHGTVVIFEDLYGNQYDLLQPSGDA